MDNFNDIVLRCLRMLGRYVPHSYTIDDVNRAYDSQYTRLLSCLNQIRDNRR
mgnify:CR=1 FL=1